MSMYDDMPLDEIIKFYAATYNEPSLDVARAQLHAALCKKLGIPIDAFKPFNDKSLPGFLTDQQAERHLRIAITTLEKGTKP